jgi:hypothetical protein
VLGGRYAVRRRLAQMPRAERWSAHDTTLERDVVVVCFSAAEPNADATLDAARRAAGVDHDRLVRILDVGRADGLAWFVEEALHEAHTLTHLLEQGGLPSEEARRIAGETATALEAARGRGLHHLRLSPAYVLRTGDGAIKVSGLATAAALAGVDDVGSVEASRVDAVGVVALTYAALTSRWPLPERVPGLEPAPHVVGGVPAPSEIAAGVPGDLDALCRLTLNDDEGPLTPGDFAAQIAPWSSSQISGLGGTTQPLLLDEGGATGGINRTLALPLAGGGQGGTGSSAGRPEATVQLPRAGATQTAPAQTPGRAAGSATAAEPPAAAERPVTGEHGEETEADGPSPAAATATAVAGAVGSALGTAGQAAGHAAGVAAEKVGSFARAAADKAAQKRAERAAMEARAEQNRVFLDDALLEGHDDAEPPLPMLPPETAAAPTRDQSKLAMGIIAGFLAVVTLLGFWGVSRIGSDSGLDLSSNTPRPTVTVTGPPTTVSPDATPTRTPSETTEEAGGELAILKATGFDPEGDGKERNSEAPRVYDGKPSTFWSSEGYASANLGGLKPGVGVLLDLGQAARVKRVALTLPDVSDVTVFLADDSSIEGATEIGSATDKKGAVTLDNKDVEASGKYVIVWFTKVSQVSDGRFRATLAEVSIR